MVKLFHQSQEEKIHEKVHRKNRQQETKCEWCNTTIIGKASLCNHYKFCSGAPKGICPHCGEKKSMANIARHRESCALKNERQYALREEEKVSQRKVRENENKGIIIKCEHCNKLNLKQILASIRELAREDKR